MRNLDWSKNQLSRASILVVEDNPMYLMIVTDLLETIGSTITSAANGKQAVHILESENFDLVIMDTEMPIMDGYEATTYIRNILKLKNLPIVALTTNETAEHRQRSLNAGMNDFISKSANPEMVFKTLAKWISLNNLQENEYPNPVSEKTTVLPVDITVLNNLLNHDTRLIRIFILKFLEVAEEIINELETARIRNDIVSIGKQGHKLKSSARSIGAFQLYELCDKLEMAAKNTDLTLANQIYDQMIENYQLITKQFEEILAE